MVTAIMAVDPGKTTGVARGLFGPGMEAGMRDALREGVEVETWEVAGDYRVQAWELAAEFHDWCEGLLDSGVYDNWEQLRGGCSLVVESFRLRQANVDLDPVMVMCGMLVLLVPREAGLQGVTSLTGRAGAGCLYAHGVPVHLQEPADAKRLATNARLKEWHVPNRLFGRPISEHRRDAYRHLVLRLAKAMGGLVDTRVVGAAPRAHARGTTRKGR